MKRKQEGNTYITEFETITELVHFIKTNDYRPEFKSRKDSIETMDYYYKFCNTHSYEEAEDMLLHGWEHGAVKIKNKVEAKASGVELKQKTVYDVAGFQCSVPRYLQGIPTNMINKKTVPQKNKVITINKSATYRSDITTQTIIDESVKVLQLVNRLEKQGYRVNLNVVFGGRYTTNHYVIKVRIKNSSQRLNIKQIAFPLVHPSMLRRIIFAVYERLKECDIPGFSRTYGYVLSDEAMKQYTNKGEYLIPPIVSTKEIIDVEQFKVV